MRKNVYLLAGGPGNGGSTAAQLRAAFENSGEPHPAVGYIGTASGDSRRFLGWFEPAFRRAGAPSVTPRMWAAARHATSSVSIESRPPERARPSERKAPVFV